LLIGREDLGDDKIGNGENDVETADCEEFFLNHAGRCAVSLYSANLIIDKIITETANIY
jgi:hypothetical protein